MEPEYYLARAGEMPAKTVWCVEVVASGDTPMVIDRRVMTNKNKALKWIDYVKANPKIWRDDTGINCYQISVDWWGWPHDP